MLAAYAGYPDLIYVITVCSSQSVDGTFLKKSILFGMLGSRALAHQRDIIRTSSVDYIHQWFVICF